MEITPELHLAWANWMPGFRVAMWTSCLFSEHVYCTSGLFWVHHVQFGSSPPPPTIPTPRSDKGPARGKGVVLPPSSGQDRDTPSHRRSHESVVKASVGHKYRCHILCMQLPLLPVRGGRRPAAWWMVPRWKWPIIGLGCGFRPQFGHRRASKSGLTS